MKNVLFLLVLTASLFFSCKENPENDIITFKFIQVNDVYEIAPLSGGKYGGMARVAHVSDSIKKETPNTFMFMAGDFLNPSLLGTIKIDGERIYGKQMVEVMNAMDFDLVTFGNHEFDLKEKHLQKRLNESTFPWMSANTRHLVNGKKELFAIQKEKDTISVSDTYKMNIKDANGNEINIGFLGVTIPSNPKEYVYYGDMYSESKRAYNELKNDVDIVFGLTHLEIEQDTELLVQIPEIPLIMGGHEHNAMSVPVGNSKVTKADANAKTIYIHTLSYNTKTKELKIDSELFFIDNKIASEPKVEAIVNKWVSILDLKIKEVIDDPSEIIYSAKIPLDGTDSASRSIQTNLGDIITEAMAWSYNNEVDAAIVNGGSIRIDDMLPPDLSSLDVFRILPFGGGILKVKIKGKLLKEVLDFGKSKRGKGAYLQRYNITEGPKGEWLIGGKKVRDLKTYSVAFSDFLLKGYDIPFLTPDNKGIKNIYTPTEDEQAYDIRKTIILYLKSKK
ncbi:MAG: bifunctional metallophosphatase/5'-nucleotidase [Flavobacteriaceae bacterium]